MTVFVHSVTQALQKTKVTKFVCRNKGALPYKEGLNHILEASKGTSWLCMAMFHDVPCHHWKLELQLSSIIYKCLATDSAKERVVVIF